MMISGIVEYLKRHHWGLIATCVALSGTAYAAGKIDSKDLARDSVRSKHVKKDALKGADINESKLGQVPSAALAGSAGFAATAGDAATLEGTKASALTIGRFSDSPSNCDPTSTSFVDCAEVNMNLPRAGRVLLMGAGRGYTNVGNCGFDVDGSLVSDSLIQTQAGGDDEVIGLTFVTGPLPAGPHSFRVSCNEILAPYQLTEAKLSAVVIGSD